MNEVIEKLLKKHKSGEAFRVQQLQISAEEAEVFVKLRRDPRQFRASIFEGNWSIPSEHPQAGQIKLLAALTDSCSVSRIIARQGRNLFAYPPQGLSSNARDEDARTR